MFPSYLKASSEENNNAVIINTEETNHHHQILIEENKNLKKEKLELQTQIAHFKSLEIKLLDCVSQYMGNHQDKIRRLC